MSRHVRSQEGSKGDVNGRVSRLVRSQGNTKGSGVSKLVRSEESFQGRCSFKTGSDATEVPRTSYVMSWYKVDPLTCGFVHEGLAA